MLVLRKGWGVLLLGWGIGIYRRSDVPLEAEVLMNNSGGLDRKKGGFNRNGERKRLEIRIRERRAGELKW